MRFYNKGATYLKSKQGENVPDSITSNLFSSNACLTSANIFNSEFYYPEEHEMAERKASGPGGHFDKVKASGDTGMKS